MKFAFLLIFLPIFPAFADLTWSNTKVTQDAQSSDLAASGVYRFVNKTDHVVKIKDVKTSCGCTTAKLDKKTYAPGESGEITAHFSIGSRLGLQTKTITVTTDDAPNNPTVLELSVNIPDIIDVGSPELTWKLGGKGEPQMFQIKARPGYKIKVTDVRCSTEKFTAAITSSKEGAEYNISVRPVKTNERAFALLIVTTDQPAASPRVVYSKLLVQ